MKRRIWTVLNCMAVLSVIVLIAACGFADPDPQNVPSSAAGSAKPQAAGSACETCDIATANPPAAPRWYKGNLHTHSLWSDGDEFPERIAAWYRDHGYQFLAISDHNNMQRGDKWLRYVNLHRNGVGPATLAYRKEFPELAKTRGDLTGEAWEIRLTPFEEYRKLFDKPEQFLLIPSEEVTDKFEKKPIHMCATNLGDPIKPNGGSSVVDVIRKNFKSVSDQGKALNRPVLAHLNHPNYLWGVTAEEMAEVIEERFFEVYNGHPTTHQLGDKDHPAVEKMWDIASTLRLTKFRAPPMMGLGTDDTHNYHVTGMNRATAGRGWIYVRAKSLSADALIAAMQAGEFYASSGVTLSDVRFDPVAKKLTLDIADDGDAEFTTQFIGTVAPAKPDGEAGEVGKVFATVKGKSASYLLAGNELYVRAVVTSNKPAANPSFEDQKKQAWTQPVGWTVPVDGK